MRNIAVFQHISLELNNTLSFSHFTVDPSNGDLFGYHEKSVYKVVLQTGEVLQLVNLENCNFTECYDVTAINFNSVSQELCLAMKNGQILNIMCFNHEAECVGFVETGIKVMEWSPDQEMLVLITGKDSVITMTGTFDPVNEVDFQDNNFGEKQFVTVGWGKKETQFHGSEGKAAAKKPVENTESTVVNDNICRVKWRGDGSLFCVSMIKHSMNIRQIKIFSREGVLQYTSEQVPGLESSLAWRPSGNLIASTQTFQNKHQVIFFEKNGLRHGEFTLPFKPHEVHVPCISWNVDSSILSILCQCKTTGKSFLQLWTVNNYHWYHKQNLVFDDSSHIIEVLWDVEVNMRLHVLCQGSKYIRYDFSWITDHSFISSEDDDACVAVIDGAKLLLTSFQKSIIPPPMFDESVTLPAAINRVVFSPTSTQRNLCVVMCDGTLGFISRLQDGKNHLEVNIIQLTQKTDDSTSVPCMDHLLWLDETHLLGSFCSVQRSLLGVISVESFSKVKLRKTVSVDGSIVSLVRMHASQEALIQLSNGQLLKYHLAAGELQPFGKSFPEPCLTSITCVINGIQTALGLSSRGRLYLVKEGESPVTLATGITSVFVLPEFLLVTSSRHFLQCISLKNEKFVESFEAGHGDRRVERGSRIVIAAGTRVVLQMPRGNLETITPRILVLHVAASLLDSANYHSAFELFRKQRINLNLLFDHNPEKFLSEVTHFVNDVHNPAWLSLFLSELSNDDVTETMYASSYKNHPQKRTYNNKVMLVCDKIREAIKKRDDSSLYLFPVLTSYVRKNTDEDLAAALKEAKLAKHVSVDEALKYLFYMVDVNEMYNIALGLYDFDLVTLVASKSTKDPKEYLPFLNELRRMEPNYQRYTIDKYLMRYESALSHISKCPEHFEECMELIKKHKLFLKALQLFEKSSEHYQKVAAAYADYLMMEHRWSEAGIMFENSCQMEKAMEAYRKVLDWQNALIVMAQLEYSESQAAEFCRSLVSDLVANRCFEAAAHILNDYLNDVEECVAVLSQGHHWLEAVRIACQNNRLDLLETHVKPGILEHKDYVIHQLNNAHQSFLSYKDRLAIVRAEKKKLKEFLDDGDQENDVQGENDLYSDTSSIAPSTLRSSRTDSKSSTRSSRSSKNRRKQERKLLSLKEGSPHEDLALLQALHQQITLCLNIKDEVVTLCKVLLRFDRDTEAAALQSLTAKVISAMQQSIEEIWTAELYLQTDLSFGPETTTNSIVSSLNSKISYPQNLHLLEPQFRYPPLISSQSGWKLKILENMTVT